MKIVRYNHDKVFTAGRLTSEHIKTVLDTPELYTIEQEWRPHPDHLGGTNNDSCVPDGVYELIRFIRPKNGLLVVQLINPDLGVYRFEDDLPPEGGRFLILMHPGNSVKAVVGCIASGLWKNDPHLVNDSRKAQSYIMQAFNAGDRKLTIESVGTKEIYVPGAD